MRRDPRKTERALRIQAADQGGYFTAAEALAAGYSYRLQHFHRRGGNWQQVGRGIYRFPDYPDSPHEDLIRWALWSRDRRGRTRAVISHETALALHELGEVMPGRVHLTVPPGFRRRPPGGCVLHRAVVGKSEVEAREGFLVTRPLRTIIDVTVGDLGPDQLSAAIHDALTKGLVRRSQLLEAKLPSRARERLLLSLIEVAERRV